MSKYWDLATIWNSALDVDKQRPYEPRDHVWASELGRSYYERYWKMKGRTPTTPPNLRSRRKFEGGNLTEWIVLQILARAGVLQSSQKHIIYEDGPIRVTGRADFVAGGLVKTLSQSDLRALPETFAVAAETITAQLQKLHPKGLREVNMEVKSCSGMIFDSYKAKPGHHHCLQAFHYAKNTGRPTMLVYVSRDDFRICSYLIMPDQESWAKLYDEDLERMAKYIKLPSRIAAQQLLEPLLNWDGEKFKKNWEVEYSNYLTDYGFKIPEEYAKPAQSYATRLNNIIKKIKEGKPIDTKPNLLALSEGYKFYPGAEAIIKKLEKEHA